MTNEQIISEEEMANLLNSFYLPPCAIAKSFITRHYPLNICASLQYTHNHNLLSYTISILIRKYLAQAYSRTIYKLMIKVYIFGP